MNKIPKPSELLLRFFRWFCHPKYREDIEGDLLERFEKKVNTIGVRKAKWSFFKDVIRLFRPSIIRPLEGTYRLNQFGMIKNYLKTAPRTFVKNPLITIVSLFSLVTGIVCFQLIHVWLTNELNTDQFHKNIDNIQVAVMKSNPIADYKPFSHSKFFNMNYHEFPNIKGKLEISVYDNDIKLISQNSEFYGKGLIVDSTFFDFFDFPLHSGNDKDILTDPKNIILTKKYAAKVFGDKNPIGEAVKIECDKRGIYQVAGLLDDIPSSSSINFDFLIPRHSQQNWGKMSTDLILTDDFFNEKEFKAKIAEMGRFHPQFPESTLSCIPFSSIYFERHFDYGLFSKYGDLNNVKTMFIIALFILLISALSFANLQTTLQLSTIKNMGIRQVNGASKFDLIIETLIGRLYFLISSTIVGCFIFELIFPFYTGILEMDLDRNRILDVAGIFSVSGIIISISMFFALVQISKIETVKALKNKLSISSVSKIQRALTTVQYAVTIILMIATTVVFIQFKYMLNKDTGLIEDNIISVKLTNQIPNRLSRDEMVKERENQKKDYHFVVDQLRQNPNIVSISQGRMPISSVAYPMAWRFQSQGIDYTTENMMVVDPEYDDLFGIEILEGRFFSDSLDMSRQKKVVINEAAKKYWGIENIDTARIANQSWGDDEVPYRVIGVVKDYHYEHLSAKIKPLMLVYMRNLEENFLIRIQDGKEQECMAFIEKLFMKVNPMGSLNYAYFTDKIEAQYKKERIVSRIYLVFTIIALMLSLISLFTFALYETKRRTKEIGIRKVSGASFQDLFSLLSLSFLKTVFIAYLVACPVAWYGMNKWLENFAYRIDMSLWVFAFAGFIAAALALLAVSWQSWSVIRINPVESLRYE
ncbi:ABC transporter permease [Reichenbachiella sp. MALMAid0571]|uniref:ABC transporter permease n=1 Tax=Reichenbachiella sp. MALMAid0571 TaxID=3143939 RepID=UPI0032DEF024